MKILLGFILVFSWSFAFELLAQGDTHNKKEENASDDHDAKEGSSCTRDNDGELICKAQVGEYQEVVQDQDNSIINQLMDIFNKSHGDLQELFPTSHYQTKSNDGASDQKKILEANSCKSWFEDGLADERCYSSTDGSIVNPKKNRDFYKIGSLFISISPNIMNVESENCEGCARKVYEKFGASEEDFDKDSKEIGKLVDSRLKKKGVQAQLLMLSKNMENIEKLKALYEPSIDAILDEEFKDKPIEEKIAAHDKLSCKDPSAIENSIVEICDESKVAMAKSFVSEVFAELLPSTTLTSNPLEQLHNEIKEKSMNACPEDVSLKSYQRGRYLAYKANEGLDNITPKFYKLIDEFVGDEQTLNKYCKGGTPLYSGDPRSFFLEQMNSPKEGSYSESLISEYKEYFLEDKNKNKTMSSLLVLSSEADPRLNMLMGNWDSLCQFSQRKKENIDSLSYLRGEDESGKVDFNSKEFHQMQYDMIKQYSETNCGERYKKIAQMACFDREKSNGVNPFGSKDEKDAAKSIYKELSLDPNEQEDSDLLSRKLVTLGALSCSQYNRNNSTNVSNIEDLDYYGSSSFLARKLFNGLKNTDDNSQSKALNIFYMTDDKVYCAGENDDLAKANINEEIYGIKIPDVVLDRYVLKNKDRLPTDVVKRSVARQDARDKAEVVKRRVAGQGRGDGSISSEQSGYSSSSEGVADKNDGVSDITSVLNQKAIADRVEAGAESDSESQTAFSEDEKSRSSVATDPAIEAEMRKLRADLKATQDKLKANEEKYKKLLAGGLDPKSDESKSYIKESGDLDDKISKLKNTLAGLNKAKKKSIAKQAARASHNLSSGDGSRAPSSVKNPVAFSSGSVRSSYRLDQKPINSFAPKSGIGGNIITQATTGLRLESIEDNIIEGEFDIISSGGVPKYIKFPGETQYIQFSAFEELIKTNPELSEKFYAMLGLDLDQKIKEAKSDEVLIAYRGDEEGTSVASLEELKAQLNGMDDAYSDMSEFCDKGETRMARKEKRKLAELDSFFKKAKCSK